MEKRGSEVCSLQGNEKVVKRLSGTKRNWAPGRITKPNEALLVYTVVNTEEYKTTIKFTFPVKNQPLLLFEQNVFVNWETELNGKFR